MSSAANNSLPSILPGTSGSGAKQQQPQQQQPLQQQPTQHRASPDQSASSQRHRGRPGRGQNLSGKYKQRNQMNQLIDGIDGLDIDLVESIAPTNRPSDSTKGRHSTVTRKVNLTHLLNHDRRHLARRRHGSYSEDRPREHHQNTFYRDSSNVHKFNKQQFLQANCQFVVLPHYDYTIHKLDPDWPVDWDCIEEVIFRQTGTTETTCPICLDPPVSAKITRCGHIYCWTCMLHYLSLSDDKSRQCPICFEPVSGGDLRSVVSRLYSDHAVDEEITMRLMFRKKGCVEIEPYLGADHAQCYMDREFDVLYRSQANLLIVDPDTVINQVVKREQQELLFKLELDREEPEVCFVEQAMDKVDQRIQRLQNLSKYPESVVKNQVSKHLEEAQVPQKDEKTFLFYQSSDGQHIYLNPFSTKILCHEYGKLENCPLEIRARILQMDWISMSESWRRRFKYLEHLPLSCEFRLIEIDFDSSNLISKETFSSYYDQIKRRANGRAFRKTEELKRGKKIQIEQNRKIYGIQPSLNINLDNLEQFPFVDEDTRIDQSLIAPCQADRSENETTQTANELDNVSVDDQLPTGSVLSFKEIQERQQAAESSRSSIRTQLPDRWASSSKTKVPQSSFAKLLVDAKSCPKQWTKSSSSKTPSQGQQIQPSGSQTQEEDGGEELRAPPYRFTLGDILVTGRPGKRSRKKASKN